MKRLIFSSVIGFLALLSLCFVWTSQSGTDDLLTAYQKEAPFTPDELTFQTVDQPLLGEGLVFHNPQFPSRPIRMHVERMALQVDPLTLKMRLSGAVINWAKTLVEQSHSKLTEVFSEFTVPDGFIRQPMEAFTLLNQDIFQGSVLLEITPSGTTAQLVCILEQGQREVLQVRTTVKDIRQGLWGWVAGHIQTVNLTISDRNLMMAMAGYYRAIRQPLPEALKQALSMNMPYHTIIRLPEPIQVSNLFTRN